MPWSGLAAAWPHTSTPPRPRRRRPKRSRTCAVEPLCRPRARSATWSATGWPISSGTRVNATRTRSAAFVGRVYRKEHGVVAGSDELSLAVARYLYKLMAYKDEYEVARLSLDPAVADGVHQEFGPDARYAVLLHPPVLRSLGVKRKIRLARSAGPTFRALRSMRRLRGTPFDPFGRTRVRKTERNLIREYRHLIDHALTTLDPSTLDTAVALACLPEGVRGYEDIKLRSVEEFRRRAAELSETLPYVREGR